MMKLFEVTLLLIFTSSLLLAKEKKNPNTKNYQLKLAIEVTDTYGVKLKKYTLKGSLEANRMEERCFLNFSQEVEKYLKSKINCQFFSGEEEYNVETQEFFQMLEEMTAFTIKNKKNLKRLTGVFQNMRKSETLVQDSLGDFRASHFAIRPSKDYFVTYKHKKGNVESVKVTLKLQSKKQ